MDPERANRIYDMLRNAGFSRNKAKILALLEQVESMSIDRIARLLGISMSRASNSLNYLLSEGIVQRMERKDGPGVGRSKHIYSLRSRMQGGDLSNINGVKVVISDDFRIDP